MAETRRYAQSTRVTPEKSLGEIRELLKRFGGSGMAYAEDEQQLAIMFKITGSDKIERRIRYNVFLPSPNDDNIRLVKTNTTATRQRTKAEIDVVIDKERTRLYRAIVEGIRGKLVMVESGIETMEQAFYGQVVTPSGETIYEATHRQISEAYRTGIMPAMLPGLPAPPK